MYRWLLSVGLLLALLLPTTPHVANAEQPLSCALAVYGSSITDWLPVIAERNVTINGETITLHICAPKQQDFAAQHVLDLTATSMQRIVMHAGVPYTSARYRKIVIGDEPEAIDADGTVHLQPNSPDWLIVQMGAYSWASRDNFADAWMIDGYADYLTGRAMADLGRADRSLQSAEGCADTPLQSVNVAPQCVYTVGAQVFADLADAVGEQTLMQTLEQLNNRFGQVSSQQMLQALELTSDKNLTPLMQGRVFGANDAAWLTQWKTMQNQRAQVTTLAQQQQLELPKALNDAVESWSFGVLNTWIDGLFALLQQADELEARCKRLALQCDAQLHTLPTQLSGFAPVQTRLSDARTLLDIYERLQTQAKLINLAPPAEATRAVEIWRADARSLIERDAATLKRGLLLEDSCKASNISCVALWQSAWDSNNLSSADEAISTTQRVLAQARGLEQRCDTEWTHCRKLWLSLFTTHDAKQLQQQINQLDSDINTSVALAERCDNGQAACQHFLQKAFQSEHITEVHALSNSFTQLLTNTNTFNADCQRALINCATVVAALLNAPTINDAQQNINDARVTLADMQATRATLAVTPWFGAQWLGARIGNDAAQHSEQAWQSFAVGRVANARQHMDAAWWTYNKVLFGSYVVAGVIVLLVVLLAFWLVRYVPQLLKTTRKSSKVAARPAQDNALLAELLAQTNTQPTKQP